MPEMEHTTQYINAHLRDVKRPNIAFYSDVSKTIFQKGKLKWRLYRGTKNIDEASAIWVTTSKSCNLIAGKELEPSGGKYFRLTLEYIRTRKIPVGKSVIVSYDTTYVCDWNVIPFNTSWETGKTRAYERPFIGSKITDVKYNSNHVNAEIANSGVADGLIGSVRPDVIGASPYWYISYLSNWAFFGGWEFDASRLDVNITTAQSLIYSDKGGVYEGRLGTGSSHNIINDLEKIRKLSVYSDYWKITQYPLPEIDDSRYNYTLPGLSRVPEYVPSKEKPERVIGYIKDMYNPALACQELYGNIWNVLRTLDTDVSVANKGRSWTAYMNSLENWYSKNRGSYVYANAGDVTLQFPSYQFPIVYGSCLENTGVLKKVTAWGTLKGFAKADKNNTNSRGHANNSLVVY